MPQVSVTHCPDCGYSLHGLPARHRCPECGFEYDEHTRVWTITRSRTAISLHISLAVAFVFAFTVAAFGNSSAARGGPARFLVPGMLLATAVTNWIAYRAVRRCCYIAITPAGLRLRTGLRCRTITWSDFLRLGAARPLKKAIRLIRRDHQDTIHFYLSEAVERGRFSREQFEEFRIELSRAFERQMRAEPTAGGERNPLAEADPTLDG